jgi:N-acetylglucosamine kinase-like BadF-type ATPase
MAYFLGVDGGGTKTEFLLGDEERELGRVRTGTIKRLRLDHAAAELNLRNALDELSAKTGVSMRAVRRYCVGTPGVAAPLMVEWITEQFAALVGGEILLVGDVEVAHDAAFRGGRGVLVLAGTGAQIVGRGADGKALTLGGWGPALSDEGSGHFLGLEGLRRAFRAVDAERPTTLLGAIQSYWQLGSIGELVEFVNTNPAPDFSQLAPLVAGCAEDGDAVALEVIRHGAQELASLAGVAIERIRRMEQSAGDGSARVKFEIPPVALAGSTAGGGGVPPGELSGRRDIGHSGRAGAGGAVAREAGCVVARIRRFARPEGMICKSASEALLSWVGFFRAPERREKRFNPASAVLLWR